MKIIAFAGMPFSGKSEAVQIAKELNIPVIRMGDMVWEETKRQGLELTDKNVGKVANDMRKEFGKDIWAKRTVEKIKKMSKINYLVIDGTRNIEEVVYFKKNLGDDFTLISIEASDKIRHNRAINRGRVDDSGDIKDILERDKRELSWGLGKVIELSDINIINEGSLEEFKNQIKQILLHKINNS